MSQESKTWCDKCGADLPPSKSMKKLENLCKLGLNCRIVTCPGFHPGVSPRTNTEPGEEKSKEEWKARFVKKFCGSKTYFYFAKKPDEIIDFIEEELAKAVAEERKRNKKRFIDFIDAHYLEYCRTQNGMGECKNCGLNKEDLENLL